MAKLYIHDGGAEQVYELFDDTPEVTFGRGPGNDVQISDAHASKVHFAVRRVRGRWRLVDLESKNGTRVGGAFRNAAWLAHGDTVTVGTFVLRFDAEGQPHGAPPARAAAPVAARPAAAALPARPAAAAPARPAAAPARPATAPAAAAPLVTMRPPAPAPAPARAPAPAAPAPSAARAPARAAPRRRPEEAEEEGGHEGRPVRRASGMPGWVVVLLIGVGALILFFILQGAMSGSNPNSVVREEAQKLREKRQYKQALEVLQRGLVPDSPGASAVLAEIENLKGLIAQAALDERENEAYASYNKDITRVIAVGNLRPAGHPSDQEAAQILRRWFAQYGDTKLARGILYAKATENAQAAGYQQIMRENPDTSRDDKQALAELDAALAPLVLQNRLGTAYERVRLAIALERLSLAPEPLKRFEARAESQLGTLADQARAMLDGALREGRALAARGDKDLGRAKVKTVLGMIAWPEPDLQRQAEEQMRGW